jgi:predicted DNA-binding protein (UPF0251 family)
MGIIPIFELRSKYMPRPKQCRRVCLSPNCTYFKPAGVPTSTLKEVVVAVDELEAMRLVDVEGLYYEQAAKQMNVSRRTFGRVIDSARKKVAQALIQGMALRIEGGVIDGDDSLSFVVPRSSENGPKQRGLPVSI